MYDIHEPAPLPHNTPGALHFYCPGCGEALVIWDDERAWTLSCCYCRELIVVGDVLPAGCDSCDGLGVDCGGPHTRRRPCPYL